ncbi:MAG TPA: ChaN family lipoprotein [Vicinamibacterales bacterium]|jgi:uncharacterized iron-regulated protein
MLPCAFAALVSALVQPAPTPPAALLSYVPQRVYDTQQKGFGDFESMLADLARADVVFVGEQHDDANTHRLELAILEGLIRRRVPLVIAMEMFERDVQPVLDRYLAGSITEEQFLEGARPWPRYQTDYRPIVEFARAHHLPIVASDVPRHIATDVSRSGLGVVDALGAERPFAARELSCPTAGTYYERFLEAMGGHPSAGDPQAADLRLKNDRFYFAQCLKDETMGESIASAFEQHASTHATIVHVNGAFHSDYAEGTAAAARRRLPGRRIAIVSVVPVDDLDRERPDADGLTRADYLLYTVKNPGS